MKTTSRQGARLIALALLIGMAASPAMAQLVVSNIQVQQRSGTAFWDVTYDLGTVGGLPVMIWLSLSTDGGLTFPFVCQTVSGDVGPGVMPGIGLQIAWNAGVDFPNLIEANCRLRVLADDGVPPAGFVKVLPGTFTMGSPGDEPGRSANEGPQHQVTLTKAFYMSMYEVTEERWYEVMGGTPTTSQLPKNYVSWDLAVQFCNALSVQDGFVPAYTIHGTPGDVTWNHSANGYRLPTEAEWEYACRAGSTTAFANGMITHIECAPLDLNLNAMGWYCGNRDYEDGPAEVGQKQANAWGLHDMHGNLGEWVWCHMRFYTSSPQVDPVYDGWPWGPRVARFGNWSDWAAGCRSASRDVNYPDNQYFAFGFRPVRLAP